MKKWFKNIFKINEKNFKTSRRFIFGAIFKNNGQEYKYLYSQGDKDIFFRDTTDPCIVLFDKDDVNLK